MKKLIACILVVVAAATVNAAYLYWQVDPAVSGFSYDAARIGYYQTGLGTGQTLADLAAAGNLNYADGTYSAPGGVMGAQVSLDLSRISNAENYSYFIELVNYNSGASAHVAYGEDLAYAALVEKNYVDTGLTPTTPAAIWHGGEYHAVPEPTSALMMVLGLAFLGLKRRKA